jgi:hypothetical protein
MTFPMDLHTTTTTSTTTHHHHLHGQHSISKFLGSCIPLIRSRMARQFQTALASIPLIVHELRRWLYWSRRADCPSLLILHLPSLPDSP